MHTVSGSAVSPTSSSETAHRRRDYLLLGFLGILVLTAGLWRGLTVDEYTTWDRSSQLPLGDLIQDRLRNGHFPTYFLLMKGWIQLFGASEVALRIPSVLMTLAALLLFRRLMGELFGRRTANTAAVIFALHQGVIWCGQTARPYAGMLLCSILAALGLLRWWRGGRAGWLGLAGVSVAVGFLFQAAFALTAVSFAVGLLARVRRSTRRSLLAATVMIAPLLFLSAPAMMLARSQEKYQPVTAKAKKLRVGGVASSLGNVAFGTIDNWADKGWRYPAFALFFGLLITAGREARRGRYVPEEENALQPSAGQFPERSSFPGEEFPVQALLWSWCFVPVVALVIWQSATGSSILSHERYFVPALGGMIALVGLGVRAAERVKWLGKIPLVLVLVASGANATAFWLSRGDGPKEVAAAMRAAAPGLPVATDSPVPVSYEYRADRPALLDLKGMSVDEASDELSRFAAGRPVWLLIYNNKDDEFDSMLETAPAGTRFGRRVRFENARAVLLEPLS